MEQIASKWKFLTEASKLYTKIFTWPNIHRIERVVVVFSLIGFLIHLLFIFLGNRDWAIDHPFFNQFAGSYIKAIYTPFSFLLIYEVFLFLVYLPKSFTRSIGKQYEIISLIVLRRIFKDISHFHMGDFTDNLQNHTDLFMNMAAVLVLFFLIGIFYHLKKRQPKIDYCSNVKSFIAIKRLISMILVPVLLGLAINSYGHWIVDLFKYPGNSLAQTSINHVFFDVFFALLIFVDVFILIISFLYTHYYSQLIRNSGFIISTILIRFSFSTSSYTNLFLIIISVVFGVLILLLYNFFIRFDEKKMETQ